jgi:glycosyltransferase involved in cell wall biosynthesis
MKIYYLPIEPLPERYTEWWYEYIPEQFKSMGAQVVTVDGDILTTSVESGTVLDAAGTNYYKASQIKKIAELFHKKEVKNGDVFFVADIWYSGIESLKYMADLTKTKIKIFGIFHAGSITMEDFMQPSHQWAKYFELGFLSICDGVFVGTNYSKEAILYRLLPYMISDEEAKQLASKIHAYGMPLDVQMLSKYNEPKKPIILFPNRFDIEKRPNVFMDAIEVISASGAKAELPFEIVFCTSRPKFTTNTTWLQLRLGHLMKSLEAQKSNLSVKVVDNLSKEEYYKLMSSASCVVSTTIEENFGYCLAESLALGTIPIMPNNYSHPEILDGKEEFLYNTFDELVNKIVKIMDYWDNKKIEHFETMKPELRDMVKPYQHTVYKWYEIIKST